MSTTQTPVGRVTSPVARPTGLPLTEAHWQAAADAVTGQPTEALRVAAVARAIADAEQRGAQNVGTGGVPGEGAPARPGHQPITEFWFEIPPSQDEIRARLTAAEQAAHATHETPQQLCYLCPTVSRNPGRAR